MNNQDALGVCVYCGDPIAKSDPENDWFYHIEGPHKMQAYCYAGGEINKWFPAAPVEAKPTSSPLGRQELLKDCYPLDWPYAILMRTPENVSTQFRTIVGVGNSIEAAWSNAEANLANPTPVSPLGQQEPDGIGWCSSCDKVHEVRRPKCPICDDWLIFAADDKPSVEGHNEGIDAAINFLHEWNKRGDYIQSAGFFASKLATVKKATNPTPVSVGGEDAKK